MILQNTIQQQSEVFFKNLFFDNTRQDVHFVGQFSNHFSSTILYLDGFTYFMGVKNDPNRSPLIYKVRSDGFVQSIQVTSITNFDNSNLFHPKSNILFISNIAYVSFVNGHGESVKVYKANTTNIMDGFSFYTEITGNFGYLHTSLYNNKLIHFTRETSGSGYYQRILHSDVGDFTTYTDLQITTNTTGTYRHYPNKAKMYGLNDWEYFFIGVRYSNSSTFYYYQQCGYKTQDFITFYSLDESFSKDIVNDGAFTKLEIDNNLVLKEGVSNTSEIGTCENTIINDVVYGSYWDESINYLKFYKIDSGIVTDFNCDVTGFKQGFNELRRPQILFNGNNLVIVCSGNYKMYTCDLNFNNLTQVYDFSEDYLKSGWSYGIPKNLNEINGNYIMGGDWDTENRYALNPPTITVPFVITNDKFIR